MRAPRTAMAAISARRLPALTSQLTRHHAVARLLLTAAAFSLILATSPQGTTRAGPQHGPALPTSILPHVVGVGLPTRGAVAIDFEAPMDHASVEAGMRVAPEEMLTAKWSADSTRLTLVPVQRWRTDQRYEVSVGAGVLRADRRPLGVERRWAFTTQTAPRVDDFQVRLAGPDLLAAQQLELAAATDARLRLEAGIERDPVLPPTLSVGGVSATTTITVSFSAPMDRADVAERFSIAPAISGALSWSGDKLTFAPAERLVPGGRYTVSLIGAHDEAGNQLDGKANFSFTVRSGAQLTVVRPGLGESGVETSTVEMWFSQPMDTAATDRGLSVADGASGATLGGDTNWNPDGTQLTFAPSAPFPQGHRIEVSVTDGRDADGNPVSLNWSFTTLAPPPPVAPPPPAPATVRVSPPVVPPPAPSSSLEGYALNQVNAARAAYGSAPLVLDAGISAVAYAHAYDQALNGYFSHTSLDGRTRDARLQAGGVSYSFSGENQCYLVGRSLTETLDWCHAQFMAEPYPGYWNHINNILNPRFTRLGVGVAQVGSKVVVTWDFTD